MDYDQILPLAMPEQTFAVGRSPVHHELTQRYYWPVAWVAVLIYLLMVALGPRCMKNRAAFDLRWPLFFWNLFLCLFSTIGVISTVPELADTLYNRGFVPSICWMGDQYRGYTGEWTWLFHASKLLELGDTVFLVLRKKPVKFLHWYHHTTVLLYNAYAYRYHQASSRWGVFINLLVHSVMYGYFAYVALGYKWSKWVAPLITYMQIVQMVVGLSVSVRNSVVIMYYEPWSAPLCQVPINVALFQVFIFSTYLFLFIHFFYVSYLAKLFQSHKTTMKAD